MTIKLFDQNSLVTLATTTTDGSGNYSFTNLAAGLYMIQETQPAGYLDGPDFIGTQGGSVGNDLLFNINLGNGVIGTGNDFVEVLSTPTPTPTETTQPTDPPCNLLGGVYLADGTPIAGVTIKLIDQSSLVILDTTTTDADGNYAFSGIQPGQYAIVEVQKDGYLDGPDYIGTQGGSVSNDFLYNINLVGGVTGVDNDFSEMLGSATPTPKPETTPTAEPTLPDTAVTLVNSTTDGSGSSTPIALLAMLLVAAVVVTAGTRRRRSRRPAHALAGPTDGLWSTRRMDR